MVVAASIQVAVTLPSGHEAVGEGRVVVVVMGSAAVESAGCLEWVVDCPRDPEVVREA